MATGTASVNLRAADARVGYGQRTVLEGLNYTVPTGGFTIIIGPNGCGKSTMLRALGRMLTPRDGTILLDGKDIHQYPAKEVAKRIGLLPQAPLAPDAITVADLVSRGRYPHQSLLRQWSPDDEAAVEKALADTGMAELAGAFVNELSGGQRQRAWIALTLAQQTQVLLLDEPTTFLDVSHQLDILDLCAQLQVSGHTLVAVLHDLNLAARYASEIVAMRDGVIVASGPPNEVITPQLLDQVFDFSARVIEDPENGRPLVIPHERRAHLRLIGTDV